MVIRPAAGVFRGTLPPVAIFGAFRRAGAPPLEPEEVRLVVRMVGLSRSTRTPLAFVMPTTQRDEAPGRWLPECRPRVSDRVFRCRGASAFDNAEFADLCAGRTRWVLAGPGSDSLLRGTAEAALEDGRCIRVVSTDPALRERITGISHFPRMASGLPHSDRYRSYTLQQWENYVRVLE